MRGCIILTSGHPHLGAGCGSRQGRPPRRASSIFRSFALMALLRFTKFYFNFATMSSTQEVGQFFCRQPPFNNDGHVDRPIVCLLSPAATAASAGDCLVTVAIAV